MPARRRPPSRNARHSGCACCLPFRPVQQLLQPRLALDQRQGAQILAVGEQQVEGEEDQVLRTCPPTGPPAGRAKSGTPSLVERQASPSIMQSGRFSACSAMAWNFSVQSSPLRVLQRRLAVLDAQLQAIAVELDLVHPARPGRRGCSTSLASCGSMKSGIAADLASALALRSGATAAFSPPPFLLLCHTAPAVRFFAVMNGVGALPVPMRDLLQGAARGDRLVVVLQQRVVVALVRRLVAMLDQQPVGALAAAA